MAKIRRMPYLLRSFSAKEPYNKCLFYRKRPTILSILCIFAPCSAYSKIRHPQHNDTRCNTLQHAAIHCNMVYGKRRAVHDVCNTLQYAAMRRNTLQYYLRQRSARYDDSASSCVAVCCSVLQCVAVCCSVLLCVAVYCIVLQRVAVCCCALQCIAVCCSVL